MGVVLHNLALAVLPLFLHGAKSSNNPEVSMGTTILAVRYRGGVVVGADTRTSVSGYVSNRYAAKLTFVLDRNIDSFVVSSVRKNHVEKSETERNKDLHPLLNHDLKNKMIDEISHIEMNRKKLNHSIMTLPIPETSTCVICRSGSAADTQHLASIVRTEVVTRQILYQIHCTVTQVASLLRSLIKDDSSLTASLICAGYDHELGRGVIYTIAPGGAVFEERSWAAGGSGSNYILGYLDSCIPKDQDKKNKMVDTEDEALDIVCNSIGLAMERDGSSGGAIRMYVIDRLGRRFVCRMPGRHNMSGYDHSARKNVQHLNDFAPAIPQNKLIKE